MALTCVQCDTPDHLIEDYRHGDLVCSKCGLVCQGCLLDDSAPAFAFQYVASAPAPPPVPRLRFINRAHDKAALKSAKFKAVLTESFHLDEDDVAINLALDLFGLCPRTNAGTASTSTFYAFKAHKRGITLDAVRAAFNDANTGDAWDDEVIEAWKVRLPPARFKELMLATSTDDLLTRMVHQVPVSVIPEEKLWAVLRTARKLSELVGNTSLKPSKFNVTLIYVALKTHGLCVPGTCEALVKGFGVGVSTVKKHELVIQSALMHAN